MTAPSTRRRRALAATLLPFLVVAAVVRADDRRGNQNPPKIEIDIAACERDLLVQTPGGALVEREGVATTTECGALALDSIRQALGDSSKARAGAKGTVLADSFLEKVSGLGLKGDAIVKLIESALASGGTLGGFAERLKETVAGKGPDLGTGVEAAPAPGAGDIERFLLKEGAERAWYALAPNESVVTREDRFRVGACDGRYVVTVSASLVLARGEVRLAAEGDCRCAEVKGAVRIGRFSVMAVAPLTFGNLTKKSNGTWTLACTMGVPHYRVVAPCCHSKDGKWTAPIAAMPVPRPAPAPGKDDSDFRNVERRCDPDGDLRRRLESEERELERQRERHADEKTLAWRKAEIARLQRTLCGCLDAMHIDPSLKRNAGLAARVEEMRDGYCTPPADEVQTPTPRSEVQTPTPPEVPPPTPTRPASLARTPTPMPTPTQTRTLAPTHTPTPTTTYTATPTSTRTPAPSRTLPPIRTPTPRQRRLPRPPPRARPRARRRPLGRTRPRPRREHPYAHIHSHAHAHANVDCSAHVHGYPYAHPDAHAHPDAFDDSNARDDAYGARSANA